MPINAASRTTADARRAQLAFHLRSHRQQAKADRSNDDICFPLRRGDRQQHRIQAEFFCATESHHAQQNVARNVFML